MRKFIIGPVLFGVLFAGFAGAANAQQHPWVPSDVYTGKVSQGSLPNGVPDDRNPLVPSDVYTSRAYTGQLPNGAPAYVAIPQTASGRQVAHARNPGDSRKHQAAATKRHTAETK
jgi:hypothetical protein